ncbi:hypothetical protein TREMEDRAFT_62339 [Tremella mesenterica DSM 1558]|uniref:uncharacterized protein n=1 Tax=Tremella mesenterica (strain ATCC 24925 / CBS 8224 / DSM 1558 / NBRC 9311 / NRRL Y-6157 / RJB 2259-6 / UBC 559-6) TaxID=578456 RepID=UPI0003F497EB|nr:uncharacterized protein TREMEDRAFT_62339 [Tremella mesenterica DSM 1558]EIW69478.1 hypothetical protein TREMEDRAFT_62339 [Tremella mesenterica DSM 1558]
MNDSTVPSPRQAESSSLSSSSNPSTPSLLRRPSMTASPLLLSTSPRSLPLPNRHGSIGHQSKFSTDNNAYPRPGRHARGSSSSGSLSNSLFGSSYSTSLPTTSNFPQGANVTRSRSVHKTAEIDTPSPPEDIEWLQVTAEQLLVKQEVRKVPGNMGMEEAVEVLLQKDCKCLLVEINPEQYAFFDYSDLNTFLLLVLQASANSHSRSPAPQRGVTSSTSVRDQNIPDSPFDEGESYLDERSRDIVQSLRRGTKLGVGAVCDISQKNPYHSFSPDTILRNLLPLFASGLHRIAIVMDKETPWILDDTMILKYLTSSQTPSILNLPVSSSSLHLALQPLISLPGTASVLDAMQVMSLNGLAALGVLSGSGNGNTRRDSFSSNPSSGGISRSSSISLSTSPMLVPASPEHLSPIDSGCPGDLLSVISVEDCTRLVIPSEGKKVLGMGLEQLVKKIQVKENAGLERGEDKVPVHTISFSATLLHTSHLILATASSRVFIPNVTTPPLSPSPTFSATFSSPISSPSLSTLSLSDSRFVPFPGLPIPPPTQLSAHYVVSTVDILSCLARAYNTQFAPADLLDMNKQVNHVGDQTWNLDPTSVARRRRASSSTSSSPAEGAFESWRWARGKK